MKKNGFTLVELLVVITIIAVIAAIGIVMYSQAQKSARKARRIADLQAIQKALETYYSQNATYPVAANWNTECSSSAGNTWPNTVANDQVIPGLVPQFMPTFPRDPQMQPAITANCYAYKSDGKNYKVMDANIKEFSSTDYTSQKEYVDPARDGGTDTGIIDGTSPTAWAVYSEGGTAF